MESAVSGITESVMVKRNNEIFFSLSRFLNLPLFFFLQTIDKCLELSDDGCSSCLATEACGWCDNRYCLQGNASHPNSAICQDWIYGTRARCESIYPLLFFPFFKAGNSY
jgi:hypothetical protein